jgi:tRNA (guanine37-N1)-methyltransferase
MRATNHHLLRAYVIKTPPFLGGVLFALNILDQHIFTFKSICRTLVTMKKFQVITLFPEMFTGVFENSMMWKAQKDDIVQLSTINLRDFGIGPRKQVDDTPYGGGDGMLLKPEPLFAAVEVAKKNDPTAKVVLMTPRGQHWKQSVAQNWSEADHGYIFICGRYEGYDERIVSLVDEQVSVGDYVLTGGELPAMTIIDSIVRLIPGVLGGEASAEIESFSDGETLEFPQYTKPSEYNGLAVPDVLLSGNHAAIAQWRSDNSFKADK